MISDYSASLIRTAAKAGWKEEDIAVIAKYSEHLIAQRLPVIFDIDHLSKLSGMKKSFIMAASNKQSLFYREFTVLKRYGDPRILSEPLPDLKFLQSWMTEELLSKLEVSKFVHSYRKKRSIKTNARLHVSKNVVVKVDIEDFFGSITFNAVHEYLASKGYGRRLSRVMASLLTLNGKLPQGAPSSPAISNALFFDFDTRVGAYAVENGWNFTRDADDITFSGNGDPAAIIKFVRKELDGVSLRLNEKKTRIMRRKSRQISCGVVLNELLGPPRSMRRDFLQEVHFIRKFGLAGHLDRKATEQPNYISSLIGRGNHII